MRSLSVVRPLRPSLRDARYLFVYSGRISTKLATNIHHVSEKCSRKRFSRSEVKGQGYNETKCTFHLHFHRVASRLTITTGYLSQNALIRHIGKYYFLYVGGVRTHIALPILDLIGWIVDL